MTGEWIPEVVLASTDLIQVGDIIELLPEKNSEGEADLEESWVGLVVNTDHLWCFDVFVFRNQNYPDQPGKVCEWTKSAVYNILVRL